jgi:hypothetical protein
MLRPSATLAGEAGSALSEDWAFVQMDVAWAAKSAGLVVPGVLGVLVEPPHPVMTRRAAVRRARVEASLVGRGGRGRGRRRGGSGTGGGGRPE